MKTTSAHASKKKKMGPVKDLHFSKISNGLKSQTMHEPTDDSPFGMGGMVPGDEMMHPSMAHAVKHLKNTFGDHMAANTGSGGATQAASTPGPMNQDEDAEA